MRIRAFYNEYIIPTTAEQIGRSVEFFEEDIPIMLTDVTKTKQGIEIVKGLKDVENIIVATVERDVYDAIPNDIKVKDRVFMFGKEYRVLKIDEIIDNQKFANKIARNPELYQRYVKKVIVLK